MGKCTKSFAHQCSSPFECNQQHLELQVIDWLCDEGSTTHTFCINGMTSHQQHLLQQLLLSLPDVKADVFSHFQNYPDMDVEAVKAFGVQRQKRDSQTVQPLG